MSLVCRATALCALCLFSAALTLLAAEGVVRKWYPVSVSVAGLDDIDGVTVMRRNVRGRYAVPGAYDITFSTNAQRFRGRKEYLPQPPPGTIRIAVLGDSFTFGAGAEDDQTYPAELERVLNRQAGERRSRVEVINAGVPGTGTGEQALVYDVWVKRFRPHLVILSVYVNDADDDRERHLFTWSRNGVEPRPRAELAAADSAIRKLRSTLDAVPGYELLIQRSQLVNLGRLTVSDLIHRYRARTGTEPLAQSPVGRQRFEDGLAVMAGEIDWLDARVREEGATLLVVFIPDRNLAYQLSIPEEVQTRTALMIENLERYCKAHGLPFANLTPTMVAAARASGSPLYYSGLDTHATPEGYRAIADAVARALGHHKLL